MADAGGDASFELALQVDDSMSAKEKSERFLTSEICLQRLILARDIADIAAGVGYAETAEWLLAVLEPLACDGEVAVRRTVAENLPQLGEFLQRDGGEAGHAQIVTVLFPLLTRLLSDVHSQVRESACQAIVELVLLFAREDVERHLVPFLVGLTESEDADMRTSAAELINETAETCGAEQSREPLVTAFEVVARDPMFRVRKAAAKNIAKLCAVVGTEVTKTRLLTVYKALAEDEIWGVRKACVESLVGLGQALDEDGRVAHIVPLFAQFATDVSRWVRSCAFQQLGPLLATMQSASIPEALVAQFAGLTEKVGGEETDAIEFCAFNFPAVAVTIGAARWDEISGLFFKLCKDQSWRVRCSLAHSLHELAALLGPERARSDLVEMQSFFLNDLEEVKIGAIKGLAAFLAALPDDAREEQIDRVKDVQKCESWRFRRILARQLPTLIQVYDIATVRNVILPLTVGLCSDRIARVRMAANRAVGVLVARFVRDLPEAVDDVMADLIAFAKAHKFVGRQTFVAFATFMADDVDVHTFGKFILPELAILATDRVPNVRLKVAHIFALLGGHAEFREHNVVTTVLEQLAKQDVDADVRTAAALDPEVAAARVAGLRAAIDEPSADDQV